MVLARRLEPGDQVRVVAPARSLNLISEPLRKLAAGRFADLGLEVSFGAAVDESDLFGSASIRSRVADLHAAFGDPDVAAVLTVIGGFNSNQLLPYLDWELIAANPKILCGYSDITALSCAIYAKTGLITYSGPHYSTFGMEQHLDQTLAWFRAALFDGGPQSLVPATTWSDDHWYMDQADRRIESNDGHWVINEGQASGTLIGGNQCTLNLLHGTEFMPSLTDAILFLEDDYEAHPATFDRDLTSLTQLPEFSGVRGIMIGRFQREVEMTREKLDAIVRSKHELRGLPVIANVDFGHTDPLMTLPVGGHASMIAAANDETELVVDFG